MDTLVQDLRFGIRRLVRAPGFAAIALLTLGLGIGANTAIFTVVNGVLLRPLPFPEPDRLVRLFQVGPDGLGSMSPPNLLDLRDRARTLTATAAASGGTFTLTGQGDPMRVEAARTTDRFFDVLQVPALYGRVLRPEDNPTGSHRVVVLSAALWRERFGSDPRTVGQSIMLSGQPYRVVGIMPAGFAYPEGTQLWVPFEYTDKVRTNNRGAWYLGAIARVAPDVSIEQATREIDTIGKQLEKEFPEFNTQVALTARPMQAYTVADVRTALLVLLGAAGFVLLIACANVANLFLARAVHREGEMALRAALGGSRGRLIRQLLTESLLLAVGGGALGLILAVWGADLLVRLKPAGIPRLDNIHIDPAVLLFTAAVTMITGVLFGCIPAWQASRVNLAGSLTQTARGAAGGANVNRLRGALIVSEMALAVLLLTGAGLLIRSFVHLQQVDPGFRTDRSLAFRLTLPSNYDTDEKVAVFYDGLLQRLRATPGVESAGAITFTPMSGNNFDIGFGVTGRPGPKPGERQSMEVRVVTPDYFATVGVPVRRGRAFTDGDTASGRPVMLLSEAAARRYFPGEDPIGRHITIGWGRGKKEPVNGDIIGIVGDVKEMGLHETATPEMYFPFAQVPERAMTILLRTKVPPMTLANTMRGQVRAADPNLAVYELQTLDDVLTESVSQSRFYMLLLGTFAGTALLLAAIGIFGVMSNAVAHRTREIGIRLALGAQGSHVRGLVLRDALVLACVGIVIGVIASLQMTTLLATLLFGLTPTDPFTFGGVALVLLGVALLSSYLPAWRASRVDPLIAMRADK